MLALNVDKHWEECVKINHKKMNLFPTMNESLISGWERYHCLWTQDPRTVVQEMPGYKGGADGERNFDRNGCV